MGRVQEFKEAVKRIFAVCGFVVIVTLQFPALLPLAEISPESLYVDSKAIMHRTTGEVRTWLISDVGGHAYCLVDTGNGVTIEYLGELEDHVRKDVRISLPSSTEEATIYFLITDSRIHGEGTFPDLLAFLIELGEEVVDVRVLKRVRTGADEEEDRSQLLIMTAPEVAVYVNGTYSGRTDESGVLLLNDMPPSRIRLKLENARYLTRRLYFELRQGLNLLKVDLERSATLHVSSNIYPLKVFCNNRFIGTIKNERAVLKIPAGKSVIRLENPEAFTEVPSVDVEPGENVEMSISMTPLPLMIRLVPRLREDFLDTWVELNVVSSRSCEVTLTVHRGNRTLWTLWERVQPGVNRFRWYGEGSDVSTFPASITFEAVGKSGEGALATSTATLSVSLLRRNSIALLSILLIGLSMFLLNTLWRI